jgi:ribonuclease R
MKKTLPAAEVSMYKTLAVKNTQQEIAAQDAERDSIKQMLVLYWKDRLNIPCTGAISGVMPYGIFVQDSETHAEGFVHISKLFEYGYLHYNPDTLTLENETAVFRLGEKTSFVFTGIKEDRNQLEAELL